MSFMSPQMLLPLLVSLAVFATTVSLVMPLFGGNKLDKRMKSVALERAEMRARERAALSQKGQASLREKQSGASKRIAESLDLKAKMADGDTATLLRQAGLRGGNALNTFLVFQLVLPFVFLVLAGFYIFGLGGLPEQPLQIRAAVVVGAAILGYFLPKVYVSNIKGKRQASMTKAWPDALDLTLICVEAGMSVEVAFRRVSDEIGMQSVPLAEELTLTTAELSFLPERRQAFQNLVSRTGVEAIKNVTAALTQAEKYGTPIGQALRVLAAESRQDRMTAAEKKAHALPPKLTVPMILFFVPVLFIVILGPAIIMAMENMAS